MDSFEACPKCQHVLSPPISGAEPCPHCGAYPFKVLAGDATPPPAAAPAAGRSRVVVPALAILAAVLLYRALAAPAPIPGAPPNPVASTSPQAADKLAESEVDAPAMLAAPDTDAATVRRAAAPTRVEESGPRHLPAHEVAFAKAANVPTLNYYYDPGNQPVAADTIGALRRALQAWSAVCNVNAAYAGIARGRVAGATVVRWNPALAAQSVSGVAIAGKGTLGPGAILLNPDLLGRHPEAIAGVLLHEVGHTLHIGHIHRDPRSVMSYLNHNRHAGPAAELSASDLTSCNEAMKGEYGVDWQPPSHLVSRRATMTDQEAVDAVRRGAGAR